MKKSKLTPILTSLLALLLCTGCYEDEGNYNYNEDIKDINVKLDPSYGVRKQDGKMSVTITPEITTEDGDKSYLEYLWEQRTRSETDYQVDTVCRTETYTLEVDTQAEDFSANYYLRLYVFNKRTGAQTVVPTRVEFVNPYTYAWMVLHETNGHAEIGAIEYVAGKMIVTPNAYSSEHGEALNGRPINMTITKNKSTNWANKAYRSQLYVTTDNLEESGPMDFTDKFKLLAPWSKLVHETQAAEIDFTKISDWDACNNSGLVVCSQGKIFHNGYYSPFMFKMNPATTLTKEYYIKQFAAGPHTAVGYDIKGHRFLHIALQSSEFWAGFEPTQVYNGGPIEPMKQREGNAIDPTRIDPEVNIIRFVNGYHYDMNYPARWQRYQCYAYGLTPDNTSQVYVIRYYNLTHADGVTIPEFYEFPTPAGINENTPMTSGAKYNNILFYGVDNKVYKLDVSTGTSTLIYQNEDTSAKVVDLKMAMEGYAWSDDTESMGEEDYGHPYCRLLGVAINTGNNKGEVVVLQLNTAGKVDENKQYPSIQIHTGFGPITEIGFI